MELDAIDFGRLDLDTRAGGLDGLVPIGLGRD